MKKKYLLPLLLIFLSVLPLIPLLHPGMFAADDSQSHVARLVSFYQSLSEGNIIPRWAGNLNMGFGHPILMFLYPLSNYLGSFWHFLGFSYINSVKLVFGTTFVLSGLFMYFFANELFGKKIALLTAVLYLFAPYHFVDFYVRAVLGEHLAFMTMPLVLWSFTKLIKYDNTLYIVLASLSLFLLILSHNAIALMFLPFFFLYLIIAVLFLNRKSYVLYRVFASLLLGFGLSAYFWLPAYVEGKYTLRDVLTNKEYISRFPALLDFFYSPWNSRSGSFLSKEVGWAQWIAVLSGLIYLARHLVILSEPFDFTQGKLRESRDLSQKMTTGLILLAEIFFWLSFILLNTISLPVWKMLTILQKFQFPWRFLSLSVLSSSLLSISVILLLKKKWQTALIIILSFLAISSTLAFWQPRGYLKENDQYFISDYKGTTDTGESSPIWSIRGMEQKAKAPIELIGGEAEVISEKRTTTKHYYKINAKNTIQLLDNTVYFPGWEVVADGKKIPIEYQDLNHMGLITFRVPPGIYEVVVQFKETKLRTFADLLSLTALLTVIGIILMNFYVTIRRSRHL